jgi:hypothetical protein
MADARCELSASQVGTGNAGNAEIGRPADTARHIAFSPILAFTAIPALTANLGVAMTASPAFPPYQIFTRWAGGRTMGLLSGIWNA